MWDYGFLLQALWRPWSGGTTLDFSKVAEASSYSADHIWWAWSYLDKWSFLLLQLPSLLNTLFIETKFRDSFEKLFLSYIRNKLIKYGESKSNILLVTFRVAPRQAKELILNPDSDWFSGQCLCHVPLICVVSRLVFVSCVLSFESYESVETPWLMASGVLTLVSRGSRPCV